MPVDSINDQFQAAYDEEKFFRTTMAPDRPLHEYRHEIYPLQSLRKLSEQVNIDARKYRPYNIEDDEFLYNYAARFVVATDGQILFSREGARSRFIPAHNEIAPTVLTAGNIIFSSDYSQIVQITNKSGHFEPSFGSLVFAIPLILNAGFPLANNFCLYNEKNHQAYQLTLEELWALIPQKYPCEMLLARNRTIVGPYIHPLSPATATSSRSASTVLDYSNNDTSDSRISSSPSSPPRTPRRGSFESVALDSSSPSSPPRTPRRCSLFAASDMPLNSETTPKRQRL